MQAYRRLRRKEASEYLKSTWGFTCKISTLAKLASIGGGPGFEYFGRWPLYPEPELDRWVRSRLSSLRQSTSDSGPPSVAQEAAS
jgi:hypothetical protein